jgi:hypothetical protein
MEEREREKLGDAKAPPSRPWASRVIHLIELAQGTGNTVLSLEDCIP